MFPGPLGAAAFRHVVGRGDMETNGGDDRATKEPILLCDPNAKVPTSETATVYSANFIMTCASCVCWWDKMMRDRFLERSRGVVWLVGVKNGAVRKNPLLISATERIMF
jgi:hypothetical protein